MAGDPQLPPLKRVRHALWSEGVPAAIAAGFLTLAGQHFAPDTLWTGPLAGFLAAWMVYFADHHLEANGRGSRTAWAVILSGSTLLAALVLRHPAFSLPVLTGFVLLALVYVLPLPGIGRVQNSPWLRMLLVAGGWSLVPFILKGVSPRPDTLGFAAGSFGLFTAAVMWSDLADRTQDRSQGRVTPVMRLSSRGRITLQLAALGLSTACYALTGFPFMCGAPLLGLLLLPVLTRTEHARWADLLLLWPWVAVGGLWISG